MSFAQTIFSWLGKLRKPDASLAEMRANAAGALVVHLESTAPPSSTWVRPQAGTPLAYERAIATTAKKLRTLEIENAGASARWLMLFDRTTVYSTNGAEPVASYPLAAGQFILVDWDADPLAFATGIVWHVSSTAGTLTRDTGASFRVSARVE